MKKQIWLAAGIAGMLLGTPAADAKAALSVQISTGIHPSFVINSAPNFIYLRSQGFSVSIGNPYDIVYYGSFYYIYSNNRWYRATNYRGPWVLILNNRLPYQIRRHRWEDIRRYRDIEYRRSDHNSNRYQRIDDNKRRILNQRNESSNRRIQEQKNRAQENRRIEEQHNRAQENRRVQEQHNGVQEHRRIQKQPKRAPENHRVQEQHKMGDENKRTQEGHGKDGRNSEREDNGGKRH
ncbi:YXWGXW repeat-containing protein [Pelodictyon phaeoclathratiforme]|nr:YXWGXW repeat-containing protein [Pelodictyon phaeoclathratiforme]MBV5289199.1 hypothetical protein [Pelodictyon phaeoclathratiforme]